ENHPFSPAEPRLDCLRHVQHVSTWFPPGGTDGCGGSIDPARKGERSVIEIGTDKNRCGFPSLCLYFAVPGRPESSKTESPTSRILDPATFHNREGVIRGKADLEPCTARTRNP